MKKTLPFNQSLEKSLCLKAKNQLSRSEATSSIIFVEPVFYRIPPKICMGRQYQANVFSLLPNTQKEFFSFAPYAKSSPVPLRPLLYWDLPPLSIRCYLPAGLLCFERHGGWWGCSCCEINRRQMHFIGDSWTRCRRRQRRDPEAPAKIATYARLQSVAVVQVA